MTRTLVIASAAYIDAELQAELGRVPPAFLPIGGRRLFVQQHAALGAAADRVLLSLPEDFEPDSVDLDLLERLGIEIVPVPNGLSLGESIVFVINVAALSGAELMLLHGDTLLRGLDTDARDAIAVADDAPAGYDWGAVRPNGRIALSAGGEAASDDSVLSGYFSFAEPTLLVQTITRARGNFVDGLAGYAAARSMAMVRGASWFDFGHSSTFYRSRQRITTERAFNSLAAARRTVRKSGANPHKIAAEARWFETLPVDMRAYTPAFLGEVPGQGGARAYELEYLHQLTLADLFVFGRLPEPTWRRILAACDDFLLACARHPAPDPRAAADWARALYLEKTLERLGQHARDRGIDLSVPVRLNGRALPSLERIVEGVAGRLLAAAPPRPTLIHGDFCFSNILYDFRADGIRVIDPRGLGPGDVPGSAGDPRYDVGKLCHSAVGAYDLIVSGYYDVRRNGAVDFDFALAESAGRTLVRRLFLERGFAGMRPADPGAMEIAILLFLSMLPLHRDDPVRQDALLANALRLFVELDAEAAR